MHNNFETEMIIVENANHLVQKQIRTEQNRASEEKEIHKRTFNKQEKLTSFHRIPIQCNSSIAPPPTSDVQYCTDSINVIQQ